MLRDLKRRIKIEFMDGQTREAVLLQDFTPNDGEISVLFPLYQKLQKFSFHEICCIQMKIDAAKISTLKSDSPSEEIITTTGKKFHVLVREELSYSSGFFGFSTDEDVAYKLIFFTKDGVNNRYQVRPVGEILEEQGIVSPGYMEDILTEQQRLKERRVGDIIADHSELSRETIEKTIDKAYKDWKSQRIRVGDILIEAGLVTKEQVEIALSQQEMGKKKKVGTLLIDKGLITEDQLLVALATKFRMRMIDLKNHIPNKKALDAIPFEVAQRLSVFPVMDNGERLTVATSQPTDYTVADNLRFYTNRKIELVVAPSQQIADAIDTFYPKTDVLLDNIIGELSIDQEEDAQEKEEASAFSESDSQIVNMVNRILLDASAKGVSDIHFEPGLQDQPFVIRYRVDGICRLAHQIPTTYKKAIMSRIKIMSSLDIAERRKPQSGKILVKYQNKRIEFRVEITPTAGGNEDAVLRILSSSKPLPLDDMDFSRINLLRIKDILRQPYGIILCVGPTGSGKTTTVHSVLGHINTVERKIWTVEDPVEITQPGLRQVQVNHRIGLDFAEILRSFLRADPDVIMIGEMRDAETAKTAIEASLTGHLVFSTLHTNSAPETIVRLIEMGMDPFNFADAFLGILAQRLARRLCDNCKKSYHPSHEEFDRIVHLYDPIWYAKHEMPSYYEELLLTKAEGCQNCNYTGYKGRVAVHELLIASNQIKKAIKETANVEELKSIAIMEGMKTLLMDGLQKVFSGLTDIDQIIKVCTYQAI
ncbi:MAG: hypothetical protein CSYNP_01339 [Syntrophus sp. SKADARSKE-3]|nr:hypothetical protein [Syntrophus sp. SKADARSKE-3]